MNKVRVPQELHLPLQILWFYQDEIMVIIGSYLLGMIVGGWAWLSLIIGPWAYMKLKRNKPRGFLSHHLFNLGLVQLEGYPSNFYREFHE